MAFSGWPDEALEFYEGLEADNSKSYWAAHKAIYEDKVLRPMTELVSELTASSGEEAKIFRPYRDVRFSKDKSLYKSQIGATVGAGYIQFSARGLAVGAGMYGMAPDQLGRYRRAVANEVTGADLERLVAALAGQGIATQSHESLKSAPRGYPADHPRIGLLRYKGVFAWKQWPVEPWLATPEAKDRISAVLTATRPLCGWLQTHVGPAAATGS